MVLTTGGPPPAGIHWQAIVLRELVVALGPQIGLAFDPQADLHLTLSPSIGMRPPSKFRLRLPPFIGLQNGTTEPGSFNVRATPRVGVSLIQATSFGLALGAHIDMSGVPRDLEAGSLGVRLTPRVGFTGSGLSSINDTFTRANNTTLGSAWTNVYNGMQIISNAAALNPNNAVCRAINNTPVAGDDMIVQATWDTGWDGNLLLGCNLTGTGCLLDLPNNGIIGTYMQLSTTTSAWSANSYTTRATSAGLSMTAGDVIAVKRVGNVYTAYQNGISRLTWTDSGSVLPRGSSLRLCGIGGSGNGSTSPHFTNWSATQL